MAELFAKLSDDTKNKLKKAIQNTRGNRDMEQLTNLITEFYKAQDEYQSYKISKSDANRLIHCPDFQLTIHVSPEQESSRLLHEASEIIREYDAEINGSLSHT